MLKKILLITMLLGVLASCNHVDNKVIPSYTVRLDLGTYGVWNTYGVNGAGDYRIFNRDKRLPANFPYNANMYTGFGGVLLIMGFDASTASYAPLAFDAACPVERRIEYTITVDPSNFEAVCPKCGSRYNVLTGSGGPISGTALAQKVGLTTYKCRQSVNGGYIITSY
ncbi:MAG: hypothetical protein MJZ63_04000 [Muribaculaceae bacterium]|nr:hypothetical protein [Muribaculaceae bacterium]